MTIIHLEYEDLPYTATETVTVTVMGSHYAKTLLAGDSINAPDLTGWSV